MANYSALVHQKKSRAFYRVQATRMMIGAGNILKKHAAEHTRRSGGHETDKATCSHICFESSQYQCTENCGSLSLGVILDGGTGQNTFYVDYCTENGSANAGADYEFTEGTLVFKPGETHKEIKVRKKKLMLVSAFNVYRVKHKSCSGKVTRNLDFSPIIRVSVSGIQKSVILRI